jgi:hypothetical protein
MHSILFIYYFKFVKKRIHIKNIHHENTSLHKPCSDTTSKINFVNGDSEFDTNGVQYVINQMTNLD